MPTLALSTGSLYTYGLARTFELAAEAGFDAMELMVDHRWDSRQPAYLQRLSQDHGLPIAVIHSPFVPHVPGWPQDPMGRLRESIALAHAVGTEVVVTHLPMRIRAARIEFYGFRARPLLIPIFLPTDQDYREFLLDGLARFEVENDITIGVENMPARRTFGHRWSVWALNELDILAGMPHLTLDTTHLGTWGLDPLAVYERLKARVIHVHLSNFDGEEHQLPEDGHLPLAGLLQRLTRDGYQGAVSLEFNPNVLQAEDAAQVRDHLHAAVRFCKAHMAG
jgi:sugar phosphate isomerase/epimerase